MVGRTGYSPDQAATYPVLYFPKTSSCKHPLTVAMKSTKCSVLNTPHYTKDSRLKTRIRAVGASEHGGSTAVDALDQDATEPSASRQVRCGRCLKAHIHSSQGGGRTLRLVDSNLRSRALVPVHILHTTSSPGRRAQGCKIHGCIPPHPLVSGINQVSH